MAIPIKFVLAGADPRYVNVSGDTMTGPLVLPADPSNPLEAATKRYVDAIAAVAGPQGAQGAQGEKGATWYVSGGTPLSTTGMDGDLYLNTVTNDVFQKTSGAWSVVAALKGPQGPQGLKGDPGPDILTATDPVTDFDILFDQDGDPLTEVFP